MKSNKECDIVRDLLPNYLENMTSQTSNEYIQNHIEKCEECQAILKGMNKEISADEKYQDKEIDFLKKIKQTSNTQKRMIIISISLLLMLCLYIVLFVLPNYTWIKDQEGNIDILGTIFNHKTISNDSYYVAIKTIDNTEISQNEKSYNQILILQINEDNNKCENYKYIVWGVKESYVQQKISKIVELMNGKNNEISNIRYNTNSYSYNINIDTIGMNKEELLPRLIDADDDKMIDIY